MSTHGLGYLMAHIGGVIAEEATNRVAPIMSSSDPAQHHPKLDHLRPKKIF